MNNETFDWNNRDPLFDEVAHYVVERQAVSTSAICDKFCIGTNRAKRIIKQLEQTHIVGEEWSSRHPREIYYCCFRNLDKKLADLATIARLQPLEDKWQAKCAAYEAKEREEWEEEDKNWDKGPVHGMKREDWNAYIGAFERQKHEMIMRELPWGGDYNWSDIFQILKFKIERMIEYWEQFGHCRNGRYVVSTMRTACSLIEIVLKDGNERGDYDNFPYQVNLRNADRFHIFHDHKGLIDKDYKQRVRYYKAYCILFKYLEYHMHNWWD